MFIFGWRGGKGACWWLWLLVMLSGMICRGMGGRNNFVVFCTIV